MKSKLMISDSQSITVVQLVEECPVAAPLSAADHKEQSACMAEVINNNLRAQTFKYYITKALQNQAKKKKIAKGRNHCVLISSSFGCYVFIKLHDVKGTH